MRRTLLLAGMLLASPLTLAQPVSFDFVAKVDAAGADNFCAKNRQTISGTVIWDTDATPEYNNGWSAEYRDESPTSTLMINCPDGNRIQVDASSNPKLHIRIEQGGNTDFAADSGRGIQFPQTGGSQYSIDHMLFHYDTPHDYDRNNPVPTSLPSVDPNNPMHFRLGYLSGGSLSTLRATVTWLTPSDWSCSAPPESVSYAFTATVRGSSPGLSCAQPGQQVTGTLTYSTLATWDSGDSEYASYRDNHTSSTLTVNCADGSRVTLDPASDPRLMIDVDTNGFLGLHADNYMGATLRHDAGTDGAPEMVGMILMRPATGNTEIPSSLPSLTDLHHAHIDVNWAYQPATGLSPGMGAEITQLTKISSGPEITAPLAQMDINIHRKTPLPLPPFNGRINVRVSYDLLPSAAMSEPSLIKKWITVLRPDGVEVPWHPDTIEIHPDYPASFSEPVGIWSHQPAGLYTIRVHVHQSTNQGYNVQEFTVEKL